MSTEKTGADASQATEKTTEQFDKAVVEPVRAYGALTTDYFEKLLSAQFDSIRALADTNLAQSRSWLEVKDSDSFRQVVEQQQLAVKELSEQLKEEADKIRTLSEQYLKDSQHLAKESMKSSQNRLEETMQKGQKDFQESLHQGQDIAGGSHRKGKEETDKAQQEDQQQAAKSKKSASVEKSSLR